MRCRLVFAGAFRCFALRRRIVQLGKDERFFSAGHGVFAKRRAAEILRHKRREFSLLPRGGRTLRLLRRWAYGRLLRRGDFDVDGAHRRLRRFCLELLARLLDAFLGLRINHLHNAGAERRLRHFAGQRHMRRAFQRRNRKAVSYSAANIFVKQMLVAETHFQLVGVHVDVHHVRRHLDVQYADGIMSDGHALAAAVLQRLRQDLTADGTPVDDKRLARAVRSGLKPYADKTADRDRAF